MERPFAGNALKTKKAGDRNRTDITSLETGHNVFLSVMLAGGICLPASSTIRTAQIKSYEFFKQSKSSPYISESAHPIINPQANLQPFSNTFNQKN
ncbi:MAG TPA: hypothetical protein PLV55_11395 [Anaerohalosphaeraceae bacterium]|nr:hypothetical protein [Anaerohalosphaeraceae bacterium]